MTDMTYIASIILFSEAREILEENEEILDEDDSHADDKQIMI